MRVQGLLLAAGAGRRMGRPKALVRGADDVPWVVSAAQTLLDGGCSGVTVVLGAAREEPRAWLTELDVTVVEADDWADGMGASLRAGLAELAAEDVEAALVHLVDLPDIGPAVIERLVSRAHPAGLARADFGHGPAHPVLIGREHWAGVREAAHGDRGARDYLRERAVSVVDCADLATGTDVDTPEDL